MRGTTRIPELLRAAILSVAVVACGGDATGPENGSADITGVVARAKTGEPVANAIVVLLRDGRVVQATPTDEAGAFGFRSVAQDSYTVRLTALELTGLDPRYVSFEPVAQPVEVRGAPVEVVFSGFGLIPPRVVGYVSCGGQPVEAASVRVIGGDTDVTVRTNTLGRYAALDLRSGFYTVVLIGGSGGCAYDPAYRVVHVRDGQQGQADFEGTA